jgi:hypothetical protein
MGFQTLSERTRMVDLRHEKKQLGIDRIVELIRTASVEPLGLLE